MKKEHINEIKGIVILAFGLILLASLVSFDPQDLSWFTSQPNVPAKNLIRIVGAVFAGSMFFLIGWGAYFLVATLFFWSWSKFKSRDIHFNWPKLFASVVLFSVISTLFSMLGPQGDTLRFERAGVIGYVIADFLVRYLGWTGSYIILGTLGTLTLVLSGEFLISPFLFRVSDFFKGLLTAGRIRIQETGQRLVVAPLADKKPKPKINIQGLDPELQKKLQALKQKEMQRVAQLTGGSEPKVEPPKPVRPPKPTIRIAPEPEKAVPSPEPAAPEPLGEYHLPPLSLLTDPPQISTTRLQQDLEAGAKTLEETLTNFNVTARVADVERGPVITRYELEPAPGVKVQKITTLADDIALAMRAVAVRIVAPIPGKNRVGIEVPNSSSATVYLKEVLAHRNFQKSKSKLMLALGKEISGKPLMADLAGMPHLLIAGTTGAGKTVCINSIIMSMLYHATPEDLKFLMVDPKMVELAHYNDLPHMLSPTVTDAKKVSAALNWVVGEMESRYNLLSKAGLRNITSYHQQGHKLPYIVVVIDELADLMQVAAKTIESAITRLAQLARAVGIHLILATQRPSVDVITGVIKANFPARVSFKVASKVDSRTVLDMNGAETLLGKGDLLFIQPGVAKPTRGQCSYVSDDEVRRVIDFIKDQQKPTFDESILQQQTSGAAGGNQEKDELYDEAVRLVIETNQASVSILQRRMRLGYTRAARLIDMMEQGGIVGPYCGSKPRDILIDREAWLMEHLNTGK